MSNFFGAIGSRVGDLVSYPVKMSKDLITDPKKGFSEMKGLYTHNTHKDQDLFQNGLGIRGWVGDHPQESAAAVVATIFGGWAAAGAYGGGAAGTAGTAGTVGSGAGAGTATAAGSGSAMASYAPATSSLFSMGNAGVGASGATAGASSFTPAMLTPAGAAASGGTYGAASAPAATGALGTVSQTGFSASSLGSVQSVPASSNTFQNALQNMNQNMPKNQQQNSQPKFGGASAASVGRVEGSDGQVNVMPSQSSLPFTPLGGAFSAALNGQQQFN